MALHDTSEAFLESMPEMAPDETFQFSCHPGVVCFNRCCGELNLMLTPYDALRLRQALEEPSKEFITRRCKVSQYPDTGFPLVHLNMNVEDDKPCPFLTPQGCSVYPHRPAACRAYPLGRATRVNDDGEIEEQFFLVREQHCQGFGETDEWTPETWMADQGLEPYNASNDRYMLLLAAQKNRGAPISPKQATMCLLALYQPDDFMRFIRETDLFSRLDISDKERISAMDSEENALAFGMNWLELLLFGHSDRLALKA